MKFRTAIDGKEFAFEIQKSGGKITIKLDGSKENWNIIRLTPHSYSILTKGKSHYLSITGQPDSYKVVIDQRTYHVQIKDETDLLLEQLGITDDSTDAHNQILAPIPGLISTIFVEPGQKIKKGDKLMILEAMKMENEIDSSISGIVEKVIVSQGQSVEKNAPLISITMDFNGNR